MLRKLATLFCLSLLVLALPQRAYAQSGSDPSIPFAVHRVLPSIDVAAADLANATTILDIHERYPSSWIREYISVEVLTMQNGKPKKSLGTNDRLTLAQKDQVTSADPGTDIHFTVHYKPENSLSHNDVKEIAFSVCARPDKEATFPGGTERMHKYLFEGAIGRIPAGTFQGYDLAAIAFTVSEKGSISDVHIVESTNDEKVDALLVETIRSMPRWSPATYADGTQVKQSFAFTAGNMENCMVHTLNILER